MTKVQAQALLALMGDLYVIISSPDPIPVSSNGKKQTETQLATAE